jgi:hypothetical protein
MVPVPDNIGKFPQFLMHKTNYPPGTSLYKKKERYFKLKILRSVLMDIYGKYKTTYQSFIQHVFKWK